MTSRVFVLLLVVLLAGSGVAFAQSKSDAEQFYSSGVQAFNSQRYAEAIDFFNKIEGLGTQDPRTFFFRGLSWSRLGNIAMATADYDTAAKMELTVAGRSYSVPKALERIQGRERTIIEQYRRAAKRAWEAEQNVRKQNEFLSQRADDMKFYQSMIDSAKSEPPSPAAGVEVSNLSLPFGANPVTPFIANQQTFRTRTASNVSQGGLSKDNQFLEDVNRITPRENPEDTKPKAPRQQDPGERGIFDSLDTDDAVEGFDINFQQTPGPSVPRNPFGGFGLPTDGGDGTDDSSSPFGDEPESNDKVIPSDGVMNPGFGNMAVDTNPSVSPAKEGGRSFGKGFASLFKKSDNSSTSSSQPASTKEPKPENWGGDEDPFADTF